MKSADPSDGVLLDYIDCGEPYLTPGYYIPMSTAISRIYTPQGFVIAADGREANDLTREIRNDAVQKIFRIEHPDRRLAYAIAGTVGLTQIQTREILFDFVAEVAGAVDELHDSKARSLWHFASALMETLSPRVAHAKEQRANRIRGDAPASESETLILIDGYYGTRPKKAVISFRHHGIAQTETEEHTSVEQLESGYQYGRPKILALLDSEDNALAAYRPSQICSGLSLNEAVAIATNRIRAHCDPIAVTTDPDCWAIGGRIHAAIITFTDGFKWVPGFEPADVI